MLQRLSRLKLFKVVEMAEDVNIVIIGDFKDVQNHILTEELIGADITDVIDDVLDHYEVASRINAHNSKDYFSELLVKLIKNYGH